MKYSIIIIFTIILTGCIDTEYPKVEELWHMVDIYSGTGQRIGWIYLEPGKEYDGELRGDGAVSFDLDFHGKGYGHYKQNNRSLVFNDSIKFTINRMNRDELHMTYEHYGLKFER